MIERRIKKAIGLSKYPLMRQFLAEMVGTFLLVLFVISSNAQSFLSNEEPPELMSSLFGGAVGFMAGVWISGGVTGTHINPAVTFALACTKKFPWRKLPLYWLAQYVGAFLAAAVTYGVYYDALYYATEGQYNMTNDNPGLAAVFAPYPSAYLSTWGAIFDTIVVSAVLLTCAYAIVDRRNCDVPLWLIGLYLGFLVIGLGVSFNLNCGFSINPARDFSPRLFTCIVGWGPEVFSYDNWTWSWIPLVIPHVGALIGAVIYIVFIEAHWPEESNESS